MSEPRRQHYVPVFYLEGFADSNGRLQVFDMQGGEWRQGKPRTVGYVNRLYDLEGTAPAAMEKALAQVESLVAPMIRRVVEEKRLPESDEDLSGLLAFAAVQAARSPEAITGAEEFLEDIAQLRNGRPIDGQRRDLIRRSARDMQVYGGAKEDPLAELVACNSRVTTAPSHGTAVMTALGACEEMYKHLVQRKWLLAVANEGCPDFVTCDSPVVTMQKTGKTAKLPRAGFHFPNTIVAFPLNRRVVLLGFNDGSERSSRHNCDTAAIAGINAAVIWATHRFVWSRRRRIYYMLNGIVNDPALAFAVRRRSSQPPAK